jgi:hypothetical protein
MDTTIASARPRDRRLLIIVALAAALVGVLVGRWSPTSAPAGAVVTTWHAPTFLEPELGTVGPAPAGYGLDGEGFVHLRGLVTLDEGTVQRANTTTGPWMIHAFTLPCGMRPETRVNVEIGTADLNFTTEYEGYLQINEDGGEVLIGSWDVPVTPLEDDFASASFVAMLETITFQPEPDSPECIDEETTTTTTTTTEPEE